MGVQVQPLSMKFSVFLLTALIAVFAGITEAKHYLVKTKEGGDGKDYNWEGSPPIHPGNGKDYDWDLWRAYYNKNYALGRTSNLGMRVRDEGYKPLDKWNTMARSELIKKFHFNQYRQTSY